MFWNFGIVLGVTHSRSYKAMQFLATKRGKPLDMKKNHYIFSRLVPKGDVSCEFEGKIRKKIWTALMG